MPTINTIDDVSNIRSIGAAVTANAGAIAIQNVNGSLKLHLLGAEWVPFIIGGIVGVILIAIMFDWALIVLTSITGSVLIVQKLHLTKPYSFVLLSVLTFLGVIIQSKGKKKKQLPKKRAAKVEVKD